jgi:V/A-type H+-transporting ATPase subunit D
MAERKPPATRQSLVRARRRLTQVDRGRELLSRKREALVTELFALATPATNTRDRIEERARAAYRALLDALAIHGAETLRAIGWPERALELELRDAASWGVPIAEIERMPVLRRTASARGTSPASTGAETMRAAAEFEALVELLVEAAPRETTIRRLGDALLATSRRVNALDQRVAPALSRQIAGIQGNLDEREREERSRLKHLLRHSSRRPAPES